MALGKAGSEGAPVYEFGFGLSWSTFEYSDLRVEKHEVLDYQPTSGQTEPAPVVGESGASLGDYGFPTGIRYFSQWIYPWLNTTASGGDASDDGEYGKRADEFFPPGATDGSAQPKLPASGPAGGNPRLWDVMYTVSCVVKNTGSRVADEVPQLYVGLGGDDEPARVLRGFERLEGVAPGQSVEFRAELTRRDLSNWDVAAQDWVVTERPKKVWVGSSSRKLSLHVDLG